MATLRTPRLLLREPEARDVPRIVSGCNDPEVARYIPVMPSPYSERHAREWLAGPDEQAFAITALGEDVLLGVIGVQDRGAVGYWLHPDARGRGIMTEALDAVVRWADGRDLFLNVHPDNAASRRVAERAGFVPAGTVTHVPPFRDGVSDALRYERPAHREA